MSNLDKIVEGFINNCIEPYVEDDRKDKFRVQYSTTDFLGSLKVYYFEQTQEIPVDIELLPVLYSKLKKKGSSSSFTYSYLGEAYYNFYQRMLYTQHSEYEMFGYMQTYIEDFKKGLKARKKVYKEISKMLENIDADYFREYSEKQARLILKSIFEDLNALILYLTNKITNNIVSSLVPEDEDKVKLQSYLYTKYFDTDFREGELSILTNNLFEVVEELITQLYMIDKG